MKSEFLIVAKQALEIEKRPMTPREIVNLAIKHGYFSDKRAGKTPHQTMKSKLSVHVRRNGENSPFVRTEPVKFYLRSLLQPSQPTYQAEPIQKPKSEEDVLVFKGFTGWLRCLRLQSAVTASGNNVFQCECRFSITQSWCATGQHKQVNDD